MSNQEPDAKRAKSVKSYAETLCVSGVKKVCTLDESELSSYKIAELLKTTQSTIHSAITRRRGVTIYLVWPNDPKEKIFAIEFKEFPRSFTIAERMAAG